ncbi:MAG: glycosyltransferase [Planctomycetes bacterium]|nr:glycosyltransferase [Planctomycetota bacterium]
MVPHVSVIVLNYNGLQHLGPCLDSLQEVRYPKDRLEVILADNASRDGSVAFVRDRYPWVRLLEFAENHGFAGGNDRAAEEASGEYVCFLNNDTRVDPGFLEALMGTIERGAACAASRIVSFDGERLMYRGGEMNFCGFGFQQGLGERVAPGTSGGNDEETLFACGCAMLMSRKLFLDVGGFDDAYFAFYEDVDLGWRLWVLGHSVRYSPGSLVYHQGDASFAKTPSESRQLLWNRNTLLTLLKNYDDANVSRFFPVALLLTLERGLYFLSPETASEKDRVLAHFAALPRDEADRARERVGLAHLDAVRQVFLALPATLEKREKIQAARRTSDADLFAKFRLGIQFDDQVNVLVDRNLAARLVPMLSGDGLWSPDAAKRVMHRHLERLEESVKKHEGAIDELMEQLEKKTEDQERKQSTIEEMNRAIGSLHGEIGRLSALEVELRSIQAKPWYKAVMSARRWRRKIFGGGGGLR